MKEIKAYVRRLLIEDVVRALRKVGAPRMTAVDVEGLGEELLGQEKEISSELGRTYSPMVKIELICEEKDVDRFVNKIREIAYTGRKGDGIIAVSNLEDVTGIRTGEHTC